MIPPTALRFCDGTARARGFINGQGMETSQLGFLPFLVALGLERSAQSPQNCGKAFVLAE